MTTRHNYGCLVRYFESKPKPIFLFGRKTLVSMIITVNAGLVFGYTILFQDLKNYFDTLRNRGTILWSDFYLIRNTLIKVQITAKTIE